ncbi:hypothetical protein H8959_002138, partial [Pygathrix nigripes]
LCFRALPARTPRSWETLHVVSQERRLWRGALHFQVCTRIRVATTRRCFAGSSQRATCSQENEPSPARLSQGTAFCGTILKADASTTPGILGHKSLTGNEQLYIS